MNWLHQLSQGLGFVLFDRFDERLIGCQRAESPAHVGVDNLQTINVAGIDPAETNKGSRQLQVPPNLRKERKLTLPSQLP